MARMMAFQPVGGRRAVAGFDQFQQPPMGVGPGRSGARHVAGMLGGSAIVVWAG